MYLAQHELASAVTIVTVIIIIIILLFLLLLLLVLLLPLLLAECQARAINNLQDRSASICSEQMLYVVLNGGV